MSIKDLLTFEALLLALVAKQARRELVDALLVEETKLLEMAK